MKSMTIKMEAARLNRYSVIVLLLGLILFGFPIYLAFVTATVSAVASNKIPMQIVPGNLLWENVVTVLGQKEFGRQLINSTIMAGGIAVGKIAISSISAFAIVFFNFRHKELAFGLIFCSLLLPVEVRIVPTYAVVADLLSPIKFLVEFLHIDGLISWFTGNEFEISVRWSLLNSFPGLILPLIASATATFMFRQTYKSIPGELVEAAKMDGTSAMRFFWDILLPLTKTNIAAITVIMFIFGWNQYLWPLLIITDPSYDTAVVGITKIMPGMDAIPEWNLVMTSALLAMLPPMFVVLVLQKWLVKGLIDSEK